MALRHKLVLLLLLLAGCTTHPIPDTFLPLTEFVERPALFGNSITTIHTSVWVNDIDGYLKLKPVNSPLYNADMIHERIHSIRQGGVFSTMWFITKYIFSPAFMWEEESICWYYEITYLQTKGIKKSIEYTARFMAAYANIFGSMISYEDAKQWVEDVYSGKWKPDISEEEEALYYKEIIKKLND